MKARPLGLHAYRLAVTALQPLAPGVLAWRAAHGKEDGRRLAERWGKASLPRPKGPLVWLHGASMGESALAWEAWRRLSPLYPEAHALFTSGTTTSAAWLAKQQGPVLHQYLPLDCPRAARRFMAHWHPQLIVFFESEIWPNLLQEARACGAVLALLNARFSARSLAGWKRWPQSAAALFGGFDLIQAAQAPIAEALMALGGRSFGPVGNLKSAAAPLPCEDAQLEGLRSQIGQRPMWVAASTHVGEEEIVLAAHQALLKDFPQALCILVPRHPERGAAIARLAGGAPRRSQSQSPEGPIYIADTLGELGVFYRLSPVALICGGLTPLGRGHNPFEALVLDCATLTGPNYSSFQDDMDRLISLGAMACVQDAAQIAKTVGALWDDQPMRERMILSGRQALDGAEQAWQTSLHRLMDIVNAAAGHAPS